jgi:hypothetical protein
MAGYSDCYGQGFRGERPRKLTTHHLRYARETIESGQEARAGNAALLDVDEKTLRRALRQVAKRVGFNRQRRLL